MAFDYYLADSDSHERVQIPEWFDIFTRSQVIEALNKFNAIGDTEQNLHEQGLEYLKQSEAHQFKVTAVEWESGMDWDWEPSTD